MSNQSTTLRYHSLDALRAFALLLGIVFHAAESFCPGRQMWAITDMHAHELFNFFQHVSHSFRMEIFFIMAGFFARLVLMRQGQWKFIKHRIKRILIPFVIGWIVLYPIVIFVWLSGWIKSGNANIQEILDMGLSPIEGFIGFFMTFQFMGDLFSLIHLWFLYQLLVIYALFIMLRAAISLVFSSNGSFSIWMDNKFKRIIASPLNILWLSVPTLLCLWFMNGWGVYTPNESLIPDIPVTMLYSFMFMVGWFLHRNQDLLDEMPKRLWLYLFIGLLLAYPTWQYSAIIHWFSPEADIGSLHKLVHHVMYVFMIWSFILGISGFFIRYFNNESPAWRYVSDSSYWLYLVHLPVVVYIQVLLAYVDLHWVIKYPLINLIAFPILFLSYHYCVRSTFIGAWLNGRKYPFIPLFRKTEVQTEDA